MRKVVVEFKGKHYFFVVETIREMDLSCFPSAKIISVSKVRPRR